MPWGRRGLWSRAAVRIKALDADCDHPAQAKQGEQERGDSTDVIAHESPPITREWASMGCLKVEQSPAPIRRSLLHE